MTKPARPQVQDGELEATAAVLRLDAPQLKHNEAGGELGGAGRKVLSYLQSPGGSSLSQGESLPPPGASSTADLVKVCLSPRKMMLSAVYVAATVVFVVFGGGEEGIADIFDVR